MKGTRSQQLLLGGLLVAVAVAVAESGCTHEPMRTASRPVTTASWSAALDRQATSDSARGLVSLATPGPDRIALPPGTFTMGSFDADLKLALALCAREPIREACSRETGYVALMLHLEKEAHAVTLSGFFLDRLEVSVGAYARCVSGGACPPPRFDASDARYNRPSLPVTHVRWQDAVAYCEWAGGRLPTEAEWEYAVRGAQGRVFPWGDAWASRRANHGSLANDDTDATDGFTWLAPVEAFPDGATPTGIMNLAGNVSEWVHDLFDQQGLARETPGYAKTPVRNPRGAESGEHMARGGSFRSASFFLRGAMRNVVLARPYGDDIGFRCAYDR